MTAKKSEIKYRFGARIRMIRERKQLTLKAVAQKAGVSESLVSQIERNKVSPSVDTLLTLADTLDIDYEYLFNDYRRQKQVSVIRQPDRTCTHGQGVTISRLTQMGLLPQDYAIEAFTIEIDAGAEKGNPDYGHSGTEFGLILEGHAELLYGAEKYHLSPGDSVSFSSDIPHILRSLGEQVLAVWVVTPPRNTMSL